jgi:hypothetical protein
VLVRQPTRRPLGVARVWPSATASSLSATAQVNNPIEYSSGTGRRGRSVPLTVNLSDP